jgi:hypothetical protein
MKNLSSAALLVAGLALGIILGKGPLSSVPEAGTDASAPEAGAPRSAKSTRNSASIHPGVAAIRQAGSDQLAAFTEQAATMTDPVEIRRLLSECLLHMTADNWREVIATFGKISEDSGRDPADEWKLALFRAGQVAGAEVMDTYLDDNFDKRNVRSWQTLYGWASKDPRAAIEWLKKVEADGHKTNSDHYAAVLSGAALSNPQDALKLLDELPADKRKGCAGNLVWNVVQNGGVQALEPVLQYASTLDTSNAENAQLAGDLFHEATQKLLWKADHSRDVDQACEVMTKLQQYGRDPNKLTQTVLEKYRYYYVPDKLRLLDAASKGSKGSELDLGYLTGFVEMTIRGDADMAAARDWMDKNPDSPLIPHLAPKIPRGQ